MNVPDLLRAGGWRLGHQQGGAPYWEHVERYGLTRYDVATAVADELAHVSRERDLLQSRFRATAIGLLDEPRPEPHWLTKDFHVLYRAARELTRAIDGHWLDERAKAARLGLSAQLERLQSAFNETEATRAELAGRQGGE